MSRPSRYIQLLSQHPNTLHIVEGVVNEHYHSIGKQQYLVVCDVALDLDAYLLQPLSIVVNAADQAPRHFNGYIISIQQRAHMAQGLYLYEFDCASWLGVLDQSEDCRGYLHESLTDVTKQSLQSPLTGQVNSDLMQSHVEPAYWRAQYNESPWQFVRRQLLQQQVLAWLEYHPSGQTLMLADGIQAYRQHTPVLDWPNGFVQQHNAAVIDAYIKTEQDTQGMRATVHCVTRLSAIGLGQALRFKGVLPEVLHKQPTVFVDAVTHYFQDMGTLMVSADALPYHILDDVYWRDQTACYRNHVDAHLWQSTLKKMHAPKAALHGVHSGRVVASGVQAKVWLPWDRNNPHADVHLCPSMPVQQRQAGDGWGMQFLPKVGDEVAVMFVDEHHPVIVASLYNGANLPPFDFVTKPSVSGIKTASGHMLAFDDKAQHEELTLSSAGDLNLTVKGRVSREIHGDDRVLIEGAQRIAVHGGEYQVSSPKSITLSVADSCIEISPDQITFTSANIDLQAKGAGPSGPLATIDCDHSCPKVVSDQPHRGGPISSGSKNVFIAGQPAARVGDTAQCHGATDTLVQGHDAILINGKPAVGLMHKTKHGGKVAQGVPGVIASGDPSLQSALKQVNVTHQPYIFQFSLQGNGEPDWQRIRGHYFTLTDSAATTSRYHINTTTLQGEAFDLKPGHYHCALEKHPRQLDIIATNGVRQLPHYDTLVNITSPEAFDIDVLWPMVMVNLREDQQHVDASTMLSQHDIDYFKRNGNNVTIFIHGFNVPLGGCSKQFSGVTTLAQVPEQMQNEGYLVTPMGAMGMQLADSELKDSGNNLIFSKTNFDATVYRDALWLTESLGMQIPKTVFETDQNGDTSINGTGAYAWAINMERNLLAAAKVDQPYYKPEYYKQFTRCLHVTWSGNPSIATDYTSAIGPGLRAGRKLAAMVTLLKQQGLTVNIVAHSLGNAVLIGCLNSLGEEAKVQVDHAFFWEAAIPNDVFFRPKPQDNAPWYDKQWYLPHAVKGTKKVSVLHSRNDNVVGEIPQDNARYGLNQSAINRSKPFWDELIPALVLSLMDFGSLYHLAMWIGVPASHLLSQKIQQQVYEHLLQAPGVKVVPNDADSATKKRLLAEGYYVTSLVEQVQLNAKKNASYYQALYDRAKTIEPKINQALKDAGWGKAEHLSVLKNKAAVYAGEAALNYGVQLGEDFFRTIGIVLEAVSPGVAAAIEALERIVAVEVDKFIPIVKGFGCLVETMTSLHHPPKPAMGQAGVDPAHVQQLSSMLDAYHNIDQSLWLWSHSGMKHPDDTLMENVYRRSIIGGSGIKQYGMIAT